MKERPSSELGGSIPALVVGAVAYDPRVITMWEGFKEHFALGALVTFLVTVADVPLFSIGAPFWGLVFGYCASRLLERGDFR